MPLSGGDKLGPYEILAPIGAGGMGEVYKARDTRLDRDVALKMLPPVLADDPARRARFETEAKAASALNHPGIVTVFDFGNQNGIAYLVTEFVDGETLRQTRPAPLRQQLDTAAQIAEALAAAHAAGITHRDLKPENVMLTRDGRAKILDFGLARQAGSKPDDSTLTQEGAILGTVGYMSPEQVRGRTADHRSDIFSLGAVLYELFSGRRAFQGQSAADTLSAILSQEPADLPSEIPAGVRQIVQHCLEKEPDRRFQSAKDLAFALRALSGNSVTAAPPIELRSAKRIRRAAWLAVPLAAVVGGFAVHAWLFTPSYVDLGSRRYTPVALNVYSTAAIPGPSWAPDGKSFVYVHDVSGRRQIFLQSLASPTPSQLTQGSLNPQFPLFSADGSRVYFLGNEPYPREVWSISTGGGAPERILPSLGGSQSMDGIALSRDGKALVIAKLEDSGKLPISLWISSPPGATPSKYPGSPSGTRPWGRARLRFSPDGSQLLSMVFERQSYELWLLPWPPNESSARGTRRILPQIKDWGLISSADWMRDGRHLVLSETGTRVSPGHLWMADVETGKLSPISTAYAQYVEPAVNPRDGRILVSQVREMEDAVEIPLDGSAPRDLVATSRRELDPAWAPVGDQFVYVTDRRGDEEIWLSSRKEGWHRPLVSQSDLPPGNRYEFVAPVWSPDGSRIAYSAGGGIWISSIAGGPATPLASSGAYPTWSPDGNWIAFGERVGNKLYLSKQKIGSSMPPVRISDAAGPSRTAWSPDGKWITIQFPDGFGLVSPDGQQKKIIFHGNPGFGSACGWSHDPSTLYLAYLKDQNLILSAFDVRTGAERKISNLGPARFSYFSTYSLLLSEAPDGKSLAGSFLRPDADIWMIEGVQPPPNFWHRLFWWPER